MTNVVETMRGGITWAYRASAPDTNAGGGAISLKVTVPLGSEMELDMLSVGPDDYTGAETIQADILDEDDNAIFRLLNTTLDNQRMTWPALGEAGSASNDGASRGKLTISGGDYVFVQTGALAQNETLTVAIRARIRGTKPTVLWAASGTLGTITTDYNKGI